MRIVRIIGGVIVGYIVMAVIIVIVFTSLQLGLGTEKVFKPGSYEAADWFNFAGLAVSLVAPIAGGFVCALIARSHGAVMTLAGLILVLGLLSAAVNMNKPDPGPRVGDVSPFEAAQKAKQPNWYAFAVPFVGAVGTIIGGRLRKAG